MKKSYLYSILSALLMSAFNIHGMGYVQRFFGHMKSPIRQYQIRRGIMPSNPTPSEQKDASINLTTKNLWYLHKTYDKEMKKISNLPPYERLAKQHRLDDIQREGMKMYKELAKLKNE